MTPEQFAEKMRQIEIRYCGDPEAMHGAADGLMCELLTELGYGEGVETFKKLDVWYA